MTGPHTKPLIFVTKALKVSNIPTSLLFSFKKDDLPFLHQHLPLLPFLKVAPL